MEAAGWDSSLWAVLPILTGTVFETSDWLPSYSNSSSAWPEFDAS
jgi:hypothetical protein